jgi:hypothetical protein
MFILLMREGLFYLLDSWMQPLAIYSFNLRWPCENIYGDGMLIF